MLNLKGKLNLSSKLLYLQEVDIFIFYFRLRANDDTGE